MKHGTSPRLHSLLALVGCALAGCPMPDGYLIDEAGQPCNANADCDDGNPCTDDACDAGSHCVSSPLDGVPVSTQEPGDCRKVVCDGQGGTISIEDDTDFLADSNDCTTELCQDGAPAQLMVEANTPCGTDGSLSCDGAGHCIFCTEDTQCSDLGNPCVTGVCGPSQICQVAPRPSGATIPAEQQNPQDCKALVCNGMGSFAQVADPNDPKDDGNPCTEDVCNGQTPEHLPLAMGTPCNDGKACDGAGTCANTIGIACTANADCASAFCVDGVCCDSSCNEPCRACTAVKKGGGEDGTCGDIAGGTDPDGECPTQLAATCGTTGACSGAGACEKYPAGTVCAAASCSGTALNKADQCDGNGSCVDAGSQSCGAYLCINATCPTSCTTSGECASGMYCTDGACVPTKQIGAPCAGPAECGSSQCVDGVCCNSACSGTCQSCNAGTNAGTCMATPFPGQDSACAANEVCNGGGGLQARERATVHSPCEMRERDLLQRHLQQRLRPTLCGERGVRPRKLYEWHLPVMPALARRSTTLQRVQPGRAGLVGP